VTIEECFSPQRVWRSKECEEKMKHVGKKRSNPALCMPTLTIATNRGSHCDKSFISAPIGEGRVIEWTFVISSGTESGENQKGVKIKETNSKGLDQFKKKGKIVPGKKRHRDIEHSRSYSENRK